MTVRGFAFAVTFVVFTVDLAGNLGVAFAVTFGATLAIGFGVDLAATFGATLVVALGAALVVALMGLAVTVADPVSFFLAGISNLRLYWDLFFGRGVGLMSSMESIPLCTEIANHMPIAITNRNECNFFDRLKKDGLVFMNSKQAQPEPLIRPDAFPILATLPWIGFTTEGNPDPEMLLASHRELIYSLLLPGSRGVSSEVAFSRTATERVLECGFSRFKGTF